MNEAIERRVEQGFAERQCAADARGEKLPIDIRAGRRFEDTNGDQAARIAIARAELETVVALHIDNRAGRQAFQIACDLVRENPRRPGAGATAFPWLETKEGTLGHAIYSSDCASIAARRLNSLAFSRTSNAGGAWARASR